MESGFGFQQGFRKTLPPCPLSKPMIEEALIIIVWRGGLF
jgi:hypothetical protein